MKIRKSTIVWFVLSVLLAASQAVEIDNSDGVTWADATYVKDAKVLPENEGKLVVVSGHPEMLEAAVDENVGVSFPSPKVYRSVEILTYSSAFKDWKVKTAYEGNSEDGFETGTLTGRVTIGAFELDQEIIKRIVGGKDVDKEERLIIFHALFSKTETGLVKTDNSGESEALIALLSKTIK